MTGGVKVKLNDLVVKANKTYNLGLSREGLRTVLTRMKRSGHPMVVPNTQISASLDIILSHVDEMQKPKRRKRGAPVSASVYASLKVEAQEPDDDSCPRCRQPLKVVGLVGGRKALNCIPCHITLPMKVE